MKLKRIFRHFLTGDIAVQRTFPAASMAAIAAAIKASELGHDGEICFAVEASMNTLPLLKNVSARERALEVFSQLRVWDTARNNGVLIYLLLADHDVEIVADRGIHAVVGNAGWELICREMEAYFRRGEFESGVIAGIQAIGNHLQQAFPTTQQGGDNELPDTPHVL